VKLPYSYIAIEGNIGAGKTTLAGLLAQQFGARVMNEHFEDNPFLADFYKDPERYALTVELSFLEERFRHVNEAARGEEIIISDYLWEKSLVFARVNLAGEELRLFERIYDVMGGRLRVPDIVFYIHRPAERLLDNINRRGREYERNIPVDYLSRIGAGYSNYFGSETRMPVIWMDNELGPEALAEHVAQLLQRNFATGLHVNP
jgi:deoxyguanosine kinase